MVSGSEFKDFPYLLTCFFSPWVPLLICFQFEEGKKKVYVLITHIDFVVVLLHLLQWGDCILFFPGPKWTEDSCSHSLSLFATDRNETFVFPYSLFLLFLLTFFVWPGVIIYPIFLWNCQVLVFLNEDGHCVPSWHWKG